MYPHINTFLIIFALCSVAIIYHGLFCLLIMLFADLMNAEMG